MKSYLLFKLISDKVFAFLFLTILSPIILFICLLIRIKLGSPVFFKQKRAGFLGRNFTIVKFRTMKNIRDHNGNLLEEKFRLTPFGSFLRNYSLDEIPSLLNILFGELSFVGPRALKYPAEMYNDYQVRRLECRQGITGWAQINGRNSISWDEKFNLDIWYLENRNIFLDLKILFLTIFKVILKKDINSNNSISMPPFQGNKKF